MRRLATVTAALALVAATFTFPAADVKAGEVGVVNVRCVGPIGALVPNDTVANEPAQPRVIAIQATFTKNGSGKCDLGAACARCLEELINDNKCTLFPGSPLVVGSVNATVGAFVPPYTVFPAIIEAYDLVCEVVE